MPEAESVSVVVGFAERLGLKLSWSQPVPCGHGHRRLVGAAVVGEDFHDVLSGASQVVGFCRNGISGLFEGARLERWRARLDDRVRIARCSPPRWRRRSSPGDTRCSPGRLG